MSQIPPLTLHTRKRRDALGQYGEPVARAALPAQLSTNFCTTEAQSSQRTEWKMVYRILMHHNRRTHNLNRYLI
jgi:hypothetical protein